MNLPCEIAFSKTTAPAVAPGLKLASRERIAQCVQMAHALGVPLPMPTVSFDLRGREAGQAYWRRNHVRLNSVLLAENPEEFIKHSIGHEVAHLVTLTKHGEGISPHGDEWQAVMQAFGLEPLRCHRFNTSNSAVGGSFPFVCGCAIEHTLSARRLKAGLDGRFMCNECKSILSPKSR